MKRWLLLALALLANLGQAEKDGRVITPMHLDAE